MFISPLLLSLVLAETSNQPIRNGDFESTNTISDWVINPSTRQEGVSLTLDTKTVREGRQALLITADRPADLNVEQELFLPVGTLWRLSAWMKFAIPAGKRVTPQIQIDSPVGGQGSASPAQKSLDWQKAEVLFRVPSPGRVTVRLVPMKAAGKVWFDDVRLDPVVENADVVEPVRILSSRTSKRPIDLKQGGQFIEPLCNLTPSMIAQQVASTSFEEEPAWKVHYKKEVDKPFRPWYPDGAVHDAKYSLDTQDPFNGKVSEKVEVPIAKVWAGISQDGFYLEEGHSYHLKLHLRSEGNIRVRASLHGDGLFAAGAVSLGEGSTQWRAAAATLHVNATCRNATLTIEFSGPGTLWLDRIYLIDDSAVLGIWRTDVVSALKSMNAGIVRFGGTTIESFEWDKCLGNWDDRVPYVTDDWGGLDPNFIGVEEFVQLCRYIGAEPLICVRWTGKKPEDAAAEIEYFNGSPDTTWGRLRARNGHPEPYRVKYWQIGNEISGARYEASLNAFAKAMKSVDPTIRLLSSFPSARTLKLDGGYLDYLCPHDYSVGDLPSNEKEFKELKDQVARAGRDDVRVAVTEWNTTGGEFGLHRGTLLTLGNALECSRYQNLLHRFSDLIEIANRSNLSDSFGSGVIQPGAGWLYLSPTYYSQVLYQRAAGSFPLQMVRSNPLVPYLQEPDFSATLSGDGKTLRIYAVNSTPVERRASFELDNSLPPVRTGQVFVLGDSIEPAESEAMNSRDQPRRVALTSGPLAATGRKFALQFKSFSVTLAEFDLAQ